MADERDGVVSSQSGREEQGALRVPQVRGFKGHVDHYLGTAGSDRFLYVEVCVIVGVFSRAVSDLAAVLHPGPLGMVVDLAVLLLAASQVAREVERWLGSGRGCNEAQFVLIAPQLRAAKGDLSHRLPDTKRKILKRTWYLPAEI